MKKEVKDTIIVELGEKIKEYPHFYLVDVTGLNAADTSALRRKCFKSDIKMVVVKTNSSTRLLRLLTSTLSQFIPLSRVTQLCCSPIQQMCQPEC